jgi:transcriptional regulator with XRE-family HTH domain
MEAPTVTKKKQPSKMKASRTPASKPAKKSPRKRKPRPENTGAFFGPALRAIRELKNVRLLELSDRLGVSLPYLSDVECGRRDPLSDDRIKQVAEYLNADPLPLLEFATKERGRVVLDVGKSDQRINTATLLSIWWPKASDEMVFKLQELLKTA